MDVEPHKLKAVAWLHHQNGKVLCVRSRGKDKFYIPGGKYEANESDLDALQREVKEELSVRLIPDSIKELVVIKAEAHGYESTQVEMKCFAAEFEGELSANAEIEELAWLKVDEKDRCAPAARLALEFLHGLGTVG